MAKITVREAYDIAAQNPAFDYLIFDFKEPVELHDEQIRGGTFDTLSLEIGQTFKYCGQIIVWTDEGFRDCTEHPDFQIQESRPGYHLAEIQKRRFGSFGKIQEEVEEALDAHRQGSHIMMLIELSDLYGAIEGFLKENYPGFKMEDLKKFSGITRRAFENGHRG